MPNQMNVHQIGTEVTQGIVDGPLELRQPRGVRAAELYHPAAPCRNIPDRVECGFDWRISMALARSFEFKIVGRIASVQTDIPIIRLHTPMPTKLLKISGEIAR